MGIVQRLRWARLSALRLLVAAIRLFVTCAASVLSSPPFRPRVLQARDVAPASKGIHPLPPKAVGLVWAEDEDELDLAALVKAVLW